MPLRNITGKLYGADGEVLVVPATFVSEDVSTSIVPTSHTFNPDETGEFNFLLHDGNYLVRLPNGVSKRSTIRPDGPWEISDTFVGNSLNVSKTESEQLKDLIAFSLTNNILQSPNGTLYKVCISDEGVLSTEVYTQ